MNNITLTGRITADPELRTTANGVLVTTFNVAVRRPGTADKTDFFSCQAWRNNAEFLCKYAKTGNRIGASGMLTRSEYTDRAGNKRDSYKIICNRVEILESAAKRENASAEPDANVGYEAYTGGSGSDFEELQEDDDLPF